MSRETVVARRWDDWRCYRCSRWFPVTERRIEHETPSGMTVGVCLGCVRLAQSAPLSRGLGQR